MFTLCEKWLSQRNPGDGYVAFTYAGTERTECVCPARRAHVVLDSLVVYTNGFVQIHVINGEHHLFANNRDVTDLPRVQPGHMQIHEDVVGIPKCREHSVRNALVDPVPSDCGSSQRLAFQKKIRN